MNVFDPDYCADGELHCEHLHDGGTCCKCNEERPPDVDGWQPPFSTYDVAERTGFTFRQLDYLVRQGAIEPSTRAGEGSGNRRKWSDLDMSRMLAIADTYNSLQVLGAKQLDSGLAGTIWRRLRTEPDLVLEHGGVRISLSLGDYVPDDDGEVV